jgi:hypothetical protein
MDWVFNAVIRTCPLHRHSRDGCLGLHWRLKEPANVSNLLSPCEWNGSTANRGLFSHYAPALEVSAMAPEEVRSLDIPDGCCLLSGVGDSLG